MTIWSIFHHWQPVRVMREAKPLNMSAGEARGKQDFCYQVDMSLSLSPQEVLQQHRAASEDAMTQKHLSETETAANWWTQRCHVIYTHSWWCAVWILHHQLLTTQTDFYRLLDNLKGEEAKNKPQTSCCTSRSKSQFYRIRLHSLSVSAGHMGIWKYDISPLRCP